MNRSKLKPGWVYCSLVQGVEGIALYINDRRVVGPKPWGGGITIWERAVEIARIRESLPTQRAGEDVTRCTNERR